MTNAKSKTKKLIRSEIAESRDFIFIDPKNREFLSGDSKAVNNRDEIFENIAYQMGRFDNKKMSITVVIRILLFLFVAIVFIWASIALIDRVYTKTDISLTVIIIAAPIGIVVALSWLIPAYLSIKSIYRHFTLSDKEIETKYQELVRDGHIVRGRVNNVTRILNLRGKIVGHHIDYWFDGGGVLDYRGYFSTDKRYKELEPTETRIITRNYPAVVVLYLDEDIHTLL